MAAHSRAADGGSGVFGTLHESFQKYIPVRLLHLLRSFLLTQRSSACALPRALSAPTFSSHAHASTTRTLTGSETPRTGG